MAELRKIISDAERVTNNETIIEQHSQDLTYHSPYPPEVVVYPKDKNEVHQVITFAYQHNVPIVPFGVGSSVEGHVIPIHGGISLDMTLMDKIVDIRPQEFSVKVQPGVTREQLNRKLKSYGLFFPVDPGANASIGGMVATNASGTNAVRYGTMNNQVLGLEVVLADGSLMKTGGISAKSSAGYHLTNLFIGSEGTLGVFTEIILKLYGIPEKTVSAKAVFSTVEQASETAVNIISAGLSIGRIELVDEHTITAVNAYRDTNFAEKPTLFLEFSGMEHWIEKDVALGKSLIEDFDCIDFVFESDPLKRTELWEARHQAVFAIQAKYPGQKPMSTDVCVPISVLPEAIENARKTISDNGIEGAIFGHVGDGNYHVVFMVDPQSQEEIERAEKINHDIVRFAIKNGGTCTGEHGIGIGKIDYLQEEQGSAYHLMKVIKHAIDSKNILNPGKIFN
ncbi:FAD-binding protein [Salicibibacter cibarius]|uniref:D-lactate dehydrogenase (cytochrome) n=2 Tax=Salicibibacter cibarius TaxID=2743000 RepID=A0A7T7CDW4_9BACI|nr:FAD-linked oxidase C-terminal domain-containing protein [Salicibibacter cibarius]QQK78438.1 FAD-binding protein [Salicibibacter cibarius]